MTMAEVVWANISPVLQPFLMRAAKNCFIINLSTIPDPMVLDITLLVSLISSLSETIDCFSYLIYL